MKSIPFGPAGTPAPNVVAGMMRIAGDSDERIRKLYTTAREEGIDFFDHADLYGFNHPGGGPHLCERRFAEALQLTPSEREQITLQTKTSIIPEPWGYDQSYEHIISSAERSMKALNTDYLDVLLLHRPDALVEPDEVARAFDHLESSGTGSSGPPATTFPDSHPQGEIHVSPHQDGYRFALDAAVTRTPVRYRNRYGIEIAADLYRPKNLDESHTHPAIVVGPPHSAVKEQAPGLYANQLAKRGFIALAFDPSFNGESGGDARRVSSPEIFAEDFSAGVDFLGTLPDTDRARIGVLGVCGSGGFALSAARIDTRIKAVVTSAMYDISGVKHDGWKHAATDADRRASIAELSTQRWKDLDAGTPEVVRAFPEEPVTEIPAGLDPISAEFFEYYGTERGHHPRAIGGFTTTSDLAHINFGPLRVFSEIAPTPVLLITGDEAHSQYFSQDVYAQTPGPKELVVVPGARHVDLYDRADLIPFGRIATFLTDNLG